MPKFTINNYKITFKKNIKISTLKLLIAFRPRRRTCVINYAIIIVLCTASNCNIYAF